MCINDSLRTGSVIPYVQKAQRLGWSVLILNPNQACALPFTPSADAAAGQPQSYFLTKEKSTVVGKVGAHTPRRKHHVHDACACGPVVCQDKSRKVPGSETPGDHVVYAWDNFLRRCPAKRVVIVAHSAGGAGTLHLVRHRFEEVKRRVTGIAFTDAVHRFLHTDTPEMRVRLIAWQASA